MRKPTLWPWRRTDPTREPLARGAPTVGRPSTGGRLVYAVGDIHGRADLLQGLLRQIEIDARAAAPSNPTPAERPLIIFLGDYIDRGADSRAAVDIVLAWSRRPDFEVRCLKGNHEQALLEFLRDPSIGPSWTLHGGRQTLTAYGAAPASVSAEGWLQTRDAFAAVLPPDHLAFYQSLELAVAVGDYLFVHAGVRPSIPLDRQSERDLLWIRHDFIAGPTRLEKIVVHGHTPVEAPFVDFRRICVDTGAYATGILTAARLFGDQQSFLQEGLR